MFSSLLGGSTFTHYVSSDGASATWALVTGASDGIGLGFAQELCARGVNVILHGRNLAKLEGVKEQLLAASPERQAEVWVMDAAAQSSHDSFQTLLDMVQALPDSGKLRILVNNVGGAHNLIGKELFHRLEDTTLDEVDVQININLRFAAVLTTALLPILCAYPSDPALILNIGSIAAYGCMPFTTLYNASNAFIHAFSKSLATEMEAQGNSVEVLAFITGSVDTPGNPKDANAEEAIFSISPQLMARNALDSVGCGKYMVFPHWKHWLQAQIIKFVPKSVVYKKIMNDWRNQKKVE